MYNVELDVDDTCSLLQKGKFIWKEQTTPQE